MSKADIIEIGSNHHYKVFFQDYSYLDEYYLSRKPEKEKGQRWQAWSKSYNFYYFNSCYKKTSYWITVEFWGDEDMTSQLCLENKEDVERIISEILTCPEVPDFDELGFL